MLDSLAWKLDNVASVIDIAVAPVFLLAGISGLLMVLTNRLGRTIDRTRSLQAILSDVQSPKHRYMIDHEMEKLVWRMHFIHFAISAAAFSAILVCLVVITLFLGSLLQLNVSTVVAGLFIVCMIVLSLSFCSFLLEILVATRALRATMTHVTSFRDLDQASKKTENAPD